MANIDNAFRTGYICRIVYNVNSQSITNNSSNVTFTVQLISTGSSYTINSSATKNGTLTVNGTTYNFTFGASLSGNQTKNLFSKTIDIPHNSDGTKSFSVRASLDIKVTLSGKFWDTIWIPNDNAQSITLTTIPRASNISSITGGTIGGSMTVNIDRKSSSFTTSVWLFLGNQAWVNVANKSTATAITFTVPTSLANAIPNATSGTGQVRIRTYNGDTALGDVTWNKTFSVPDYKPTINNWSVSEVGTGLGVYVQGKSKMKYSCSASSSYGASITSYTWKFGSATLSSASGTTGIWNSSGTVNYSLTVKDSRGKTNTWSHSLTYQPYSPPVARITGYRCDDSGNPNNNSTKVKAVITGTVSSVSGKNTVNIKVQSRATTGSSWATHQEFSSNQTNKSLILLGFNTEQSHQVKITVTDKWTSTTTYIAIPTTSVLMDFKAGGNGLAIGKVAEKDGCLECEFPAQFNKGVFPYSPNITGLTAYDATPYGISITDTTDGINNGLPIDYATTMTFNVGMNRQFQLTSNMAGRNLWYRAGHVDNTTGTATGWSPWYRIGLMANSSGKWWNEGVVCVGTNGVSEVGKYLDFHESNTGTDDYAIRLIALGKSMYCESNVYPNGNNKYQLGSTDNRWSWLNLVNSPNVSSDRTMKENIQYLRNNTLSNDDTMTYSDMYNFVRDDLELAKYNFKGQDEEEINFIAQDLLYNLDGTNNKVGQFIVNPVAPNTEEEIEAIKEKLEEGQEYHDPTLSYDMGNYVSVLAGALKSAINEIEILKQEVILLKQIIDMNKY